MEQHLTFAATGMEVVRAFIHEVVAGGTVYLSSNPRPFDVLSTDNSEIMLSPGDEVLAWSPHDPNVRGVVLGRIGASNAERALPDTLLLEATEELTLRVGDGSITIRKDGKILIKGTDLVSNAKRMNRVKGGAVAIN